MKISKKIKIFILSLVFMLVPSLALAADEGQIVGVDSQVSAYLIGNEETGEIFYQKDAETPYPIASMSKLMTYLVTKEAMDEGKISMDQKIKVSKKAEELAAPGYSHLGLKEGDQFTVEELLNGLMVVSGNDCAVALAEAVAGSEAKFVRLMNQKAEELNLSSQAYYNASGLQTDNDNQNTSSAIDLFKLCQVIIKKYPEVLDYASIRKIEDKKRDISQESTIPLVDEIKGVDGLKTGSTDEAGYCLTTTVNMKEIDAKDNFRTIGIVMGADSHEARNLAMSDLIYYVSRYYNTKEILNKDVPAEVIKMNTASQGYIELYPDESVKLIVKNQTAPATKFTIDQEIKAPIKAGQKMGSVDVTYNDQDIKVDLLVKNDVKEASKFTRVIRTTEDACNFLLECIIAR